MRLLIVCICFLPFIQAQASEPLTIDGLSALITQKKITSIEALLPELPPEFRSNTVFVYDSQSTQYADALNPRSILSSRNSNLILAIESAAAPDSERMELIQFDPKKRTFDFFEGTFAGGKPALILPRTDCARCHREDLRPNWQAYSHWAGVYGSDDGNMDGSLSPPNEKTNYESFLKKASNDPRYQWLSQTTDTRKTNQDFTEIQGTRNFARVSRMLSHTPAFARFKYAYLGSMVCTGDFNSFLPTHLKPTPAVDRWMTLQDRSDDEHKSALYYLFGLQGIQFGDFSMSFKPSQTYFDQYFTTPYYPAYELAYSFLSDMPELTEYVNVSTGSEEYPDVPYAMTKGDAQCSELAQLSVQALKDFKPAAVPTVLSPPAAVLSAANSCLACHVGSSELAPAIPFDDEIALKRALSAGDQTLYQELLKRIAPDAPSAVRMPPKGALSQTDRETLRSYIDTLMR